MHDFTFFLRNPIGNKTAHLHRWRQTLDRPRNDFAVNFGFLICGCHGERHIHDGKICMARMNKIWIRVRARRSNHSFALKQGNVCSYRMTGVFGLPTSSSGLPPDWCKLPPFGWTARPSCRQISSSQGCSRCDRWSADFGMFGG